MPIAIKRRVWPALELKQAFKVISIEIAMMVHDLGELVAKAVRGNLLRVGCPPIIVERFCLESIVVLYARQRGKARSAAAIIKLMSYVLGLALLPAFKICKLQGLSLTYDSVVL